MIYENICQIADNVEKYVQNNTNDWDYANKVYEKVYNKLDNIESWILSKTEGIMYPEIQPKKLTHPDKIIEKALSTKQLLLEKYGEYIISLQQFGINHTDVSALFFNMIDDIIDEYKKESYQDDLVSYNEEQDYINEEKEMIKVIKSEIKKNPKITKVALLRMFSSESKYHANKIIKNIFEKKKQES